MKNKPVSGHRVDLLLDCGCIEVEAIEAVIFSPSPGEARYCQKHKRQVLISRVGTPYWEDEEQKNNK